MSVKVLSFMKIQVGKTMNVVKALQEISEVIEIHYITGEFDAVAIIEADTPIMLQNVFHEKIDQIPWIITSSSNLLLKSWKN